jgi:predicted transcriptional regulator
LHELVINLSKQWEAIVRSIHSSHCMQVRYLAASMALSNPTMRFSLWNSYGIWDMIG